MAGTSEKINALVQGLPQELFDEVYRFTFTVSVATAIEITETYIPPKLLQVDRASRSLFAASYYARNTFFAVSYRDAIIDWECSLTREHIDHFRDVYVQIDEYRSDDYYKISPPISFYVSADSQLLRPPEGLCWYKIRQRMKDGRLRELPDVRFTEVDPVAGCV